ncbi:MAG: glycosyltransferase [Armatimonadota bacterium]|nr:glycosyltransferase [Armatimonadota bacterium]
MAIKLVDVEITKPLPKISGLERYSRVWVFVNYEGVPIDRARIENSGDEISPERLAMAIADQTGPNLLRHRLYQRFIGNSADWESGVDNLLSRSEAPERKQPQPFISVIVCTRDRAGSLGRALDSLTRLDYPEFEVLIVDNCPSDDSAAEVAERYCFQRVVEPLPGLDFARGRGIAEAKGEIVAFTDDDATADPGWLRGIANGFADPKVMCVTGLVLPAELETRAQELFEVAYGGFGRGFGRATFDGNGSSKYESYWPSLYGTGCNMAYRKEVFDKMGGFDPAFDVGTPTGGGGDMEMFHRLARAGCVIAYRPDAVVRHRHRADERDLRRLLFNYGRSFTAFLTKCMVEEKGDRFKIAKFLVRWYVRWFVKRALRLSGPKKTDLVMPMKYIAVEAVGSFTGPWAYFKSRRNATRLKTAAGGDENAD